MPKMLTTEAMFVNVKDYGAKADSKFTTGNLTAGTGSLVVPSAIFSSSDVGKTIYITGAGSGGATLVTTIAGYNSPTQVSLPVWASTTVTNAVVGFMTNDGSAINAAKNAAGVGGKLYFPPGTYSVDGMVPLAGQTWELHENAVLKIHPNASTLTVMKIEHVDDVTLIGGTIDGAKGVIPGSGGHMFHVLNAKRVKIRNVTFQNSRAYGLGGGAATDLSIRNCRYINCADGIGTYGYHPTYGASTGIEFCENYVDMRGLPLGDLDNGGFTSYGNTAAPNKRVLISGNTFFVNKDTVPSNTGCIGVLYTEDAVVSDNICVGGGIGISIASSSKRVVVANNHISGFYDYGLEFANTEDCVASGNIIDARGAEQFAFSINGTTKRATVTGNSIEATDKAGKACIQITATVSDVNIVGNNFISKSSAAQLGVLIAGAQHVFIRDNSFFGNSLANHAIRYLSSIGRGAVSNNYFNGYLTAALMLDADPSAVTVDNVLVTGNTLRSTPAVLTVQGFATQGANLVPAGNMILP